MGGSAVLFTRENVRRIIKDERYTGCLVGRKRTVVDLSTKRTEPVPKEEWIVAENTHEVLVTKEIFIQAQAVLKPMVQNKPVRKPYQKFRGLVKCSYCGRTLMRTVCKQTYFSCPTAKTVAGCTCAAIHMEEAVLEDILLTAVQAQVKLLLDDDSETKENTEGHLSEEIKACQSAISRYKTLQMTVFEDYAEGRIERREYLSRKQEIAEQQEEAKNCFEELTGQLAQLQGGFSKGTTDMGKYAFAKELTREMLVELVKEIRISEKDTVEILWNFQEPCSKNDVGNK